MAPSVCVVDYMEEAEDKCWCVVVYMDKAEDMFLADDRFYYPKEDQLNISTLHRRTF